MPPTLLYLPNFDLLQANFDACFLGGKVCENFNGKLNYRFKKPFWQPEHFLPLYPWLLYHQRP